MSQHHHLHWIAAAVVAAASLTAHAHGDEPHGDAPHAAAGASATPRFEAATEAFEIVGRLEFGALTLFINRFETSEPVFKAAVELESGERKAVAAFQADQGSYVVSDAAFVQALAQRGSHPLVVTVAAGNDADLLEATFSVAAPAEAAHDHGLPWPAGLGVTAVLATLAVAALALRKRRINQKDRT